MSVNKQIIDLNKKKDIRFIELIELYCKQCKLKNIAQVTIDGYKTACRYFLGRKEY